MSQISGIADHFLSSRASSGPTRIALIGTRNAIPVSFLTANLALEGSRAARRVMAIQGEGEGMDLGYLFCKRSLPLLEEQNESSQAPPSPAGINLVPFRLTSDSFRSVKPPQWEKLKRQEGEADLLLLALPADPALSSWTPIVKSLHAVVLQAPVGENKRLDCYRILRFLYFHNPFLQVHFVGLLASEEEGTKTTVSDGLSFYEHLSSMAGRFLRQELIGPYLWILESRQIHNHVELSPPVQLSSLTPFLERLAKRLLNEQPAIERAKFPGFFASLEAAYSVSPNPWWEQADLFTQLGDYFLLDSEVGPKKATLLLNWERRLAVGEMAAHGVGEALVRGTELLEWARDHLALLARLYHRKVDPALPPHLVLISADYPAGFCDAVGRMGLSVVLYKVCEAERGTHVVRLSPPLQPAFSQELSSEEEKALLRPVPVKEPP